MILVLQLKNIFLGYEVATRPSTSIEFSLAESGYVNMKMNVMK